MDFSTSVFIVPFTRRQTLHATQLPYPSEGPYPRFSALHATQLPYPASGPYPRFSALHATKLLYTPEELYTSAGPYTALRAYILSISLLIPL